MDFSSLILKYDKQIPRYTSYPTAPHFNLEINSDIHKSWLKVKVTLDQSEVEGYVLRRYTSPIK